MSAWIPVERLPDGSIDFSKLPCGGWGKPFLVSTKEFATRDFYVAWVIKRSTGELLLCGHDDAYIDWGQVITHWMPIPEVESVEEPGQERSTPQERMKRGVEAALNAFGRSSGYSVRSFRIEVESESGELFAVDGRLAKDSKPARLET